MDTLVVTRTAYRLTEKLHQEHTEAMDQLSKGHPYDMSTNIFNRLPQFFFNEAPNDGNKYIRILGRENSSLSVTKRKALAILAIPATFSVVERRSFS